MSPTTPVGRLHRPVRRARPAGRALSGAAAAGCRWVRRQGARRSSRASREGSRSRVFGGGWGGVASATVHRCPGGRARDAEGYRCGHRTDRDGVASPAPRPVCSLRAARTAPQAHRHTCHGDTTRPRTHRATRPGRSGRSRGCGGAWPTSGLLRAVALATASGPPARRGSLRSPAQRITASQVAAERTTFIAAW